MALLMRYIYAIMRIIWCYGQDSNLRTPAGKDIPSAEARPAGQTLILSPSPLTWLGYRSLMQYKRFDSGLLTICRSLAMFGNRVYLSLCQVFSEAIVVLAGGLLFYCRFL